MDDCEEIKFYSPKDVIGGQVKPPACDPVDVHVPNELREPTDNYDPSDNIVVKLDPIRLFNISKEASCNAIDEQLIGEPGKDKFVVSEAAISEDLDIFVIDDISTQVIRYIFDNKLIEVIQQQLYTRTCTAEWLVDMTGMTYDQAQRLISRAQAIQWQLDERAQQIADAGIDCYYANTPQAAMCDQEHGYISGADYFAPEKYFTEQQIIDYFAEVDEYGKRKRPYSDLQGGIMYYYVPFGVFKSKLSQEDADNMALQAAIAAIVCLFVNDPIIVDCTDEDRPDRPRSGGKDKVPTPTQTQWDQWVKDHNAYSYNLVKPVGTVQIPEGTVVSYSSIEDANERAKQLGWSRLVCYYINDRQEAACDDEEARGDGIIPGPDNPRIDADIRRHVKGQHVVVPEGYIQSDISIKDANDQAVLLTQVLLECCYTNDPQEAVCPPIEVYDEGGNLITVLPAPTGSAAVPQAIDSWVVPAGTFFACQTGDKTPQEIKESLNRQAYELAQLQLVCYYCNQVVLPTCVPSWVIDVITRGVRAQARIVIPADDRHPEDVIVEVGEMYTMKQLELPLEPARIYNPFTGEKEDISKWSINATAGVPPDYICYQDYYPDPYITNVTNQTIKQTGAQCPFSNDLVIAGCRVNDPYGGVGRTPADEPYIFFSQHPREDIPGESHCISDVLSSPITDEYVEVPAGTFVFTELDVPDAPQQGDPDYDYDAVSAMVKQAANDAALTMAKAMLYCVFANPVTYVSCDTDGGYVNYLCADKWWFSQNLSYVYPGRQLMDGSPTIDAPIVIPYGMFISKESIQEVYDMAEIYANSMMFCFFGNTEQYCTCEEKGESGTQYSEGKITENVIIDQNPYKADMEAKKLACATVVCIDLEQGPEGPEGPQGPQGPTGPPGQPGSCPGECMGVYT